jgi:hypothetical protein
MNLDFLEKPLEVGEVHSRIVIVIPEPGLVFQFPGIHFADHRAYFLHHSTRVAGYRSVSVAWGPNIEAGTDPEIGISAIAAPLAALGGIRFQ